MGIMFGLCLLLISPLMLFAYGIIRQLKGLHEELQPFSAIAPVKSASVQPKGQHRPLIARPDAQDMPS